MNICRADVVAFLARAVRDILEREERSDLAGITEETPLWGREGAFSSLMLVELMLAVEDFCAENSLRFVWTNDAAMSERRSVYRSVGSLTDFILSLPSQDISDTSGAPGALGGAGAR